ncbi:hypothetical protein SEA_JSQUARED_68 [Mycobacterium phage Jsquared]|uniref:hypothetical protein n=1 Tax=Mycobacterium phage Serenity TaxID=1701853 RepID=UPI0006CE329B|nr:hypothetical protein SEA_SERENITY_67 [Mycobacterium phage Serenity]ALF00934.1 hypothetical protein SEA_SERENITY_67 [Mycobacterium phage Serenity]ATN92193.1 hypothetical protein SEA_TIPSYTHETREX_64 [Mycobacterium phage TipsytheTRex]AVP41910.1 hypothetical protein SEA_JSQUARED_68 [Mycobacterium phage Jsquared]
MCGGCRGEGGFSPRCFTQPGSLWRRVADAAESLGDLIGAHDGQMANEAYRMAGRAMKKWEEAQP